MAVSRQETVKDSDKIGYKVVILSEPGGSKSSLVMKLKGLTFPKTHVPDIGVPFHAFSYPDLNLEVWDMAGKKTPVVYPVHLKNATTCVLVFDLTNPDSFDNLEVWITEVIKFAPKCNIMLVGTKTADEAAQVTEENIKFLEEKYIIPAHQTIDENNQKEIQTLFDSIAQKIRASVNKAPGQFSLFEEGKEKPRAPEPTCYKPPTCSIC
jgi:Ras-related protein Rab-1A